MLTPTFAVLVDGSPLSDAFEVVVTFGVDQDNGTCIVPCRTRPAAADGRVSLIAYMGWNGSTSLAFDGEITEIEWDMWPPKVTLVGQDLMARLRKPWGNGHYEYDSTVGDVDTDRSVAQNLVEKSGIDSSDTHIEGAEQEVGGPDEPLQLRDGSGEPDDTEADIPLQIIRELDELTQYATHSRPDAIYRLPVALGTPAASYSQGNTGLRALRRRKNFTDITNKFLVTGLDTLGFAYSGSASAPNSYLPYPFEYNARTIRSNLIQSDAWAQAIADAMLARYNRPAEVFEFTLDGNLSVLPATTLRFTASNCEMSAMDVWVTHVEHRCGSDFVTTGTAIGLPS